jgi:DNA end-binding protein Ku
MATRSSWKGCLQLSLVCVPVKAYSTASSGGGDIHLNQLHADCHRRIQYKKTCPLHGEVTNDQIVSGYRWLLWPRPILPTANLFCGCIWRK